MKIAVFDIGTNSIHLLIVEIYRDLTYRVLGHEKDVTRLGDGSFEALRLSPEASDRALNVIDRYSRLAKMSRVRKIIAVATSAVREAANGGEFIEEVLRKTGMKVQVVTGEEEARLIFLGALSSIETRGKNVLVLDVGGGSAELIAGDREKVRFLRSYRLGSARLAEQFLKKDPPSGKQLRKLDRHIRQTLRKSAGPIRRLGCSMTVGTAGTLINLASVIHHHRWSQPLERVNHYEFTRADLEEVQEMLSEMTVEERKAVPGLDPKRADIITAGGALVLAVMKMLKLEKMTLSDRGIREGIILDYIEKNRKRIRVEEDFPNLRERSVLLLGRRCQFDEPHARHVAYLAGEIFKGTRRLHKLGPSEAELLRFASLLHDIGYYVSYRKHHKHSYYLIVNSDMDGFTPEEVQMLAAVARYHRRRLPKKSDIHLSRLKKREQNVVRALAAILRIADGLDRTHFSVVRSLRCRLRGRTLYITMQAKQDAEIERWQAAERSDLFEDFFKKKVRIRRVRSL